MCFRTIWSINVFRFDEIFCKSTNFSWNWNFFHLPGMSKSTFPAWICLSMISWTDPNASIAASWAFHQSWFPKKSKFEIRNSNFGTRIRNYLLLWLGRIPKDGAVSIALTTLNILAQILHRGPEKSRNFVKLRTFEFFREITYCQ